MVLSILLRHIRSLPQGAPQQTMLLCEAARQAQALPSPFAIPALISTLQVFSSPGTSPLQMKRACLGSHACRAFDAVLICSPGVAMHGRAEQTAVHAGTSVCNA